MKVYPHSNASISMESKGKVIEVVYRTKDGVYKYYIKEGTKKPGLFMKKEKA